MQATRLHEASQLQACLPQRKLQELRGAAPSLLVQTRRRSALVRKATGTHPVTLARVSDGALACMQVVLDPDSCPFVAHLVHLFGARESRFGGDPNLFSDPEVPLGPQWWLLSADAPVAGSAP